MIEKEKNLKETWWQPAVALFGEVSSWIAAPIILALVIGKWLDGYFGTKPWIFLGLVGVSFIISCVGIFRIVKRYAKSIQDLEKEKNNQEDKKQN